MNKVFFKTIYFDTNEDKLEYIKKVLSKEHISDKPIDWTEFRKKLFNFLKLFSLMFLCFFLLFVCHVYNNIGMM